MRSVRLNYINMDYDPIVFDEYVKELNPSQSYVSIRKGRSLGMISLVGPQDQRSDNASSVDSWEEEEVKIVCPSFKPGQEDEQRGMALSKQSREQQMFRRQLPSDIAARQAQQEAYKDGQDKATKLEQSRLRNKSANDKVLEAIRNIQTQQSNFESNKEKTRSLLQQKHLERDEQS